MHNRFVHVAAVLSAGVLILFATTTVVANPVTVDVSFSGTDQTNTFSQTIPLSPPSILTLDTVGVFLGSPFVSDPAPQTDQIFHAGGTTFTSTNPMSLTDDGNPTGSTAGPTPITTQMSFGAFDWQLQDINNFHVDLINGTDILGDWNTVVHEILVGGGLPGTIKIDLFHRTYDWSFRQVGAPTIGTDGSFSIPTNLAVAFDLTSEGLRPIGSESVHGSGTTLLTSVNTTALIDQDGLPGPDLFALTGNATTTVTGDAFGAGATSGTRDVLLELDGTFSQAFAFNSGLTTFAANFGPSLGATGSLDLVNTFLISATYHLQQLLTDVHRLRGDISGDGIVDIGDFTLWADSFGATGDGSQIPDISMDGRVDIGDFTLWADQFQATGNAPGGSGGASAVPEPSSLVLLCLGLVGMASYGWRRRRRRLG